LSGSVLAKDFLRLGENQHPATGERLMPELKTARIQNGRTVAGRGHDLVAGEPNKWFLAGMERSSNR